MSSIVEALRSRSAPRTGLPPRRELRRRRVRAPRPCSGDAKLEAVAVLLRDGIATGPGPTCALALADRGERLRRRRRATRGSRPRRLPPRRAATSPGDEPPQQSRCAGCRPRRRARPRLRAQQVDRRERDRNGEQADLDEDRLAVGGLPERRRASAGGDTTRTVPEPTSTSTETNATFEKRGTATTRPATRVAAGRLRQSTSSPTRPPIQSEPDARCSQSSASDEPARRRLRGVARRTRARAASQPRRAPHPTTASSSASERCSPLRPVDPDRDRARGDEEREAELEVEVAAAERRGAHERDERADREHRAEREVRRREQEVDRDRDEPDGRRRRRTRSRRCAGSSRDAPRPPGARSRAAARAARSPPSPRGRRPSARRSASASRRSRESTGSRTAAPARGSGRPRT